MPVRRVLSLIVLALASNTATSLEGQSRPWAAGLELSYNAFAGGATGPQGSKAFPSDRFAYAVVGSRELGAWLLRLEAGYAPGHLAARDSGATVEITQLTTSMPRTRIEPLVGRSVARMGNGALLLYLGPTLDWWRLDGFTRFTIGGEARLALQAPLGRLVLENYIGFGLAPQPFPAEELDPTITTHTLQTFTLGLSLRVRL